MPTTVYSQNFDGVSPPNLPAGLTADASNWVTSATQFVSSPNSLRFDNGGIALSNNIFTDVTDGGNGNSQVDVAIYVTDKTSMFDSVILRSLAKDINNCFRAYFAAGGGWSIGHRLGGVSSPLATNAGGDGAGIFDINTWYDVTFTADSSNVLTLYVKRRSDGFYLNVAGSYQSTLAYAIQTTDGAPGALNGAAGYAGIRGSGSGFHYFDNFVFTNLNSGVTVARAKFMPLLGAC